MGSRKWVKLWCRNWLEGTLKDESIEIRGVWAGLLALAGDGRYGDSGEIKLSNEVGLTDNQISEILSISLSLWKRAKRRFVDSDRIRISEKGAISIQNWAKYQSEYERQKPQREAKKAEMATVEKYTEGEYQQLAVR